MRAIFNGETIAQSEDTVLVEGNHYFPPDDVFSEHLDRSRLKTLCPWKGIASYYTVTVGGASAKSAAWTYRHPSPFARRIKDHIAFSTGVELTDS